VGDYGSGAKKMAEKLRVLTEAPDFELKDTHGQTVRLASFRGRQPLVLVFTRGFT
jgi:peroxiredoxin